VLTYAFDLWERAFHEIGDADYKDIKRDYAHVDATCMWMVKNPEWFDVIVTDNMFGDILSDLAAAVTGGLGLAPSASLGDSGPGLFEPVHGSAPDVAGRGIANPAAMLRSTALLLEHALGRQDDAAALEAAVDRALERAPTPDLGGSATTQEFTDAALTALEVARTL